MVVSTIAAVPVQAAKTVTPDKFKEVSSGVALIHTFGCRGKPLGQGTGFLVGTKIVMTARHVTQGACKVRVRVGGGTYFATRVDSWYGGGASSSAADLATIKLDRHVVNGYVFRVRSNRVPLGLNVGNPGYPLGNRLSFNQGKIIDRGKVNRAPLIAVRMLGAEGGSGSPFIDNDGRVVGILQVGLGSEDVLGQRTSGVLVGLDLVRWWGPRARLDLCRAYPSGGIAGCSGAKPPPPPATETVRVVAASVSGTEDGPPQTSFLSASQVTVYLRVDFASPTTTRHTATDYAVGPSGQLVQGCEGDIRVGWEGFVCEYTLNSPAPGSWRIVYVIDGRERAVGFEVTSSAPPPPPAPAPHIQQCWTQDTGGSNSNWNPASAIAVTSGAQILARGAGNYRVIAALNRSPSADIIGVVSVTLIQPNGQTFASFTIPNWQAQYNAWAVDLNWKWTDGSLFFQHPERSGQGSWTFQWKGPDGQLCNNAITIS